MGKVGEMIGINQMVAAGIDKATAGKVVTGQVDKLAAGIQSQMMATGLGEKEAASLASGLAMRQMGITAEQQAIIKGVQASVGKTLTNYAGQIAGGVGTTSLLEWRLPQPEEFLDMAVLMGMMHGAGKAADKLKEIYARTGKTPGEVARDIQSRPSKIGRAHV